MTESTISAYDEFIFESAEQYLQTVVLIDDRIYENKSESVISPLDKPPTERRKAALKSVTPSSDTSGKENNKEKEPEKAEEVSFRDVQNSFAKKRIICSLYQPKKSASFGEQSEAYKLCSVADVVVVDWDLHGDSGRKATDLVGILVKQSMRDIPHQLRLILIYTIETNLGAVANNIYEALMDRFEVDSIEVIDGSEGLILTTDNSRVVILGKRPNPSLPQYSEFFVPEKDLAERTITEFSRLASGLLQGIVLRGFAKLRENNRRILTRFHKDLDIAFLTHRSLLLPDESFGQIIPLLTDELRAVLEDTLGEYPLGAAPSVKRILDDWCDKHWIQKNNAKLKIGNGANGSEFVKDVFCNGPAIKKDYSRVQRSEIPGLIEKRDPESPKWKEGGCDKLAEYLLGDSEVEHCHEKLSSLMSQRVRYDNAPKELHLGVIIRELADETRYLLCLQPICDSVRMKGKRRAFIFSSLNETEEGKRFTNCVMDVSGTVIRLDYKPMVSSVFVSIFQPGTDAVLADQDNTGRLIFEDADTADTKEYEWIAELKIEHAQRAAEQFGRELSRVGLTESEWLRIKAK